MLSILSALCGSQIFYQKIQLTPRTLPVGVCLQGACVWQILNGLCLVLLLRKWTWHYSSITTAIPPLISPLFSSLPPLSLRLSPSPRSPQFFSSLRLPFFLSGLFKSSFVFFLLSVRSQFFAGYASFSLCVFLLFIMILPNSPCVQYIPYFSFPFTVFSPRVYRSPLLSIFKSAPFHHYSLHHSSSLLIF